MPQIPNLKCKGLYTHPNELGSVPEGALLQAVNCVIDREDVLENRRGSRNYGDDLGGIPTQLFSYKNRILVHLEDSEELKYDSDGAGTWATYAGDFLAMAGRKMRSFESNQNFYFTTSEGIKKLDGLTSPVVSAGMPMALDGTATLNAASGGFLTTANCVAYRLVWGLKDLNENLILGAPSQRITVSNSSGGSKNVDLEFSIPDGITENHIYQVYRSALSGSPTVDANDELQLVYEGNPTAGQIAAKLVTLTDITPVTLMGMTLYTSDSQEGSAQMNGEPPWAKDVAVFRNHALYANTQVNQNLFLTLIGTGAPSLAVDDTIVIDGVTFTAKGTENSSAKQFKLFGGGTPADDIEATAQSLVRVINRATGVSVYAYYMSGYEDLPGKMWIRDRVAGGAGWAVTSSKGSAFSPVLPTSGTTVGSSCEAKKNRIYIAKEGEPEAVPYAQYLEAGSADKELYRVIALRDSTFILKEDGIFRLTGNSIADFQVVPFDNTAIILGVETAVALNNQVFAYSTQGVVAISDTGVRVVSRAVETDLSTLSSDQYPNFKTLAFAAAYESERKYLLFVPALPGDTHATEVFVYNTFTNAWTTWLMDRTCALVNLYDDRLYCGSALTHFVRKNRKEFLVTDYAEDEYALNIVSATDTTVEVDTTADAVVGQTLMQGTDLQAVVTEVIDSTHLEVDRLAGWTAASAKVYDPIPVTVQWTPAHGGNPGLVKHFPEATLFFKEALFESLQIRFGTNFSRSGTTTDISPQFGDAFGDGAFGDGSFGGDPADIQPIRTYIPLEEQRGNWISVWLEHEEACTQFALNGIALVMEPMETRFR